MGHPARVHEIAGKLIFGGQSASVVNRGQRAACNRSGAFLVVGQGQTAARPPGRQNEDSVAGHQPVTEEQR